MRSKMAIAPADRSAQLLSVPGVELVECSPASGSNGDGEDHLDSIQVMNFDQAAKHVGLDGAEIDRHEGVRDDRQATLVADRVDRVVE